MIHAIDTLSAQREAFEACSLEVYKEKVMQPLEPFWKPFTERFPPMGDADPIMNAAQMMGFYTPQEGCELGLESLLSFAEARTWDACVSAAEKAFKVLNPSAHGINLDPISFTLVLGSLNTLDIKHGAYTGFQQEGAAIVMGYPNPVGTPRLPVASAHEIHHIVRFAYEPFMPDLTLGKYIVAEGLAESFGLEIVGDSSLVGPYCTALSAEDIEQTKPRFKDAIHESDFDVVRGYIFGDWAADKFRYAKQGVPDFSGYTLGFELVQAYLAKTGKTAAEATYLPWQEIVDGSSYFV